MERVAGGMKAKRKPKVGAHAARPGKAAARSRGKVRLLAGGNPQIAKGHGDEPVRRYIAAMPGWKRALGARLDALIVRTVPEVRKAVKYNSPLYGLDGRTWFLSFHVFDRYLKVAFHRGASLVPPPPVGSKIPSTRYVHVAEDGFDEVQLAAWVKQAAALPGEVL